MSDTRSHCVNCRWWIEYVNTTPDADPDDQIWEAPARHGHAHRETVEQLAKGDRIGMCSRVVQGHHDTSGQAWTEDGSDYYSALVTRAGFGCVLWDVADQDVLR